VINPSWSIKVFTIWFGTTMVVSIVLAIIAALLMKSYLLSTYAMIEQMQIIFLLALIKTFFPVRVMWFFKMMKVLLFGFNFTKLNWVFFENTGYEYEQTDSALELLGFEYKSGLINIFGNLVVFTSIFILHGLAFLFYINIYKNQEFKNKCERLLLVVAKVMTGPVYMRYLMLSLVLYLVACLSDINYANFSNEHAWSFFVSFSILVALILFISVPIVQYFLMLFKRKIVFYDYFKELNYGIKDNFIAKLYPIVYFIRRVLLCTLVTIGSEVRPNVKLGLFFSLEIVYFVGIVLVRPFINIQDNFVAIFNCVMMVFYIFCLFFYNNDHEWNKGFTYSYLSLILANS
jgi:hypothetical protein